MGIQDICLPASTVMAHLDLEEIDVSEITTQTVYDSGYESEVELEEESDKEPPFSSFNTSPSNIEVHRKVKLKDKEIDQKNKSHFSEKWDHLKIMILTFTRAFKYLLFSCILYCNQNTYFHCSVNICILNL